MAKMAHNPKLVDLGQASKVLVGADSQDVPKLVVALSDFLCQWLQHCLMQDRANVVMLAYSSDATQKSTKWRVGKSQPGSSSTFHRGGTSGSDYLMQNLCLKTLKASGVEACTLPLCPRDLSLGTSLHRDSQSLTLSPLLPVSTNTGLRVFVYCCDRAVLSVLGKHVRGRHHRPHPAREEASGSLNRSSRMNVQSLVLSCACPSTTHATL